MATRRRLTPRQLAARKRRRKRRRRVLLSLELIVLLVLAGTIYVFSKTDMMQYNPLDEDKLEVYQDTGDYTNIALFGLDSRAGELGKGVHSDTIMIASIHNNTHEVQLVSLYRDTLLQQADGTYDKATQAYFYGGPEEAIALLNRNLDLDIKKYLTVNFNALIHVITALGGIEIDITEEELPYVNSYTAANIEITGIDSPGIEEPGLQTLNGVQAVAYARIRYTAGDDFKRTERQREVLEKVAKKAQQADLATLNSIINAVLPQVSTNLTTRDFLALAAHVGDYQIVNNFGFPYETAPCDTVRGMGGSYVISVGHASNVKQLHRELFADTDYAPSEKVETIDAEIQYLSGIYPEPEETEPEETAEEETSQSSQSLPQPLT